MKKLVLSVAFLGFGFLGFAQQQTTEASASRGSNVDFAQMKENRLQKLKTEYNLTDEQFAKVRELADKRDVEQKKLQAYQASERARIAKENEEGMRKILTPEQFKIYTDKNNRKPMSRPLDNGGKGKGAITSEVVK